MAVALTSDITKGILTGGTPDTVATAAAGSKQETWSIIFRNYSASDRDLSLWINGTSGSDLIYSASVEAGGSVVLTISVGPGDYLAAQASAATSIAWTCSKGILS